MATKKLSLRGLGVFICVLLAELIGVYLLTYRRGIIMNDAISRTANAYFVLFLEPQKLASIGFVWNPMPSLLQIPILLLAPLWKPIAAYGISGGILTAFFAALNAGYIYRLFQDYGLGKASSLLLVALYALNPFIFFYGTNGMSETLFFTTLLISFAHFLKWMKGRRSFDLVTIALALMASFLIRYESVALCACIGAAMLIVIFFMGDPESSIRKKSFGFKRDYTTASFAITFTPVLFIILVWVFINWMIMGDPLYFLNSSYSNSAQSSVASIDTNVANAVLLALRKSVPFLFPFMAITLIRLMSGRLLKKDYLILLLSEAVFIGFHIVMIITGSSFAWLRFFSYSLPIGMAWYPYELSKIPKRLRAFACILLSVALLLSSAVVYRYLGSSDLATEEHEAIHQPDSSGVGVQRQFAELINMRYPDSVILMDSFMTSTILLNIDPIGNVITTSSDNFEQAIEDPWKYAVEYFVLVNPKGVGEFDAINQAYPNLYEEGADWCDEVEELHSLFKLMKITY